MSNAAKHRKKAAEFEQLKQIDRAIASYVKAIEESEAAGEDVDVALFNKVGDLALRQGRVPDAITYYERAVEHYATSGLFNNAIALCNKILRNAPGRANVYFTLGRICARKGLRGDATRNFLEYATRMQQEGRVDEGMRALAEVADLMPELTEVRALVEEHAARAGIALPRRRTPARPVVTVEDPNAAPSFREQKSQDLVFLDVDYGDAARRTPARSVRVPTPAPAPAIPAPAALVALPEFRPVEQMVEPVVALPFLDASSVPRLDGLDSRATPAAPTPSAGAAALPGLDALTPGAADASAVMPTESAPLEGLKANGVFEDLGIVPLDGFTADAVVHAGDLVAIDVPYAEVHWLVPPTPAEPIDVLEDVVLEDFADATNDSGIADLISTETPPYVPALGTLQPTPVDARPIEVEPLVVSPVPELDEAIAAGAALVARAEAEFAQLGDLEVLDPIAPIDPLAAIDAVEERLEADRPPFRLDPHDFILPGELPPLLLEDAFVEVGLAGFAPADDGAGVLPELLAVDNPAAPLPSALDAAWDEVAQEAEAGETDHAPSESHDCSLDEAQPVMSTPALPIAAVAVEAVNVATSRRDGLRAAVTRMPQNWLLRRRLAEALFEVGEREAALAELETAQQGLVNEGDLVSASDIAEELVRVSPDLVPYHQKRVELAVRVQDSQRLRLAYLDLADVLVRMGEEGRARAVYARVLEIDPHDDRARLALGAAAPPPPERPDDRFVDLAEWLRDDDEPVTTRMRMREPTVTGDEQADFDALLRHFKEGVARSLGEDDFESHYDLGVAYKEMGLLDDAIAEFQKALRSRAHRLPAYEALGQCFVELGRHQVAATVLSRALHEPGLDDEQRVGVLYLLAYSCEVLQRSDEARSYYQRVYAIDIQFRDVAARLAALEQVSR